MEQLGFDGMPERLYACTPSRLNTWQDCPRRYRMTYLDRPMPPKGPPWAHNSVGASVHNALAAWWRLPEPDRTPTAAGALLTRGWITEGFRDGEQSAAHRERARDMVERYAAGLDPSDEPIGVERTVAARTARIAVSGRIDRLDARGGELVVVDYKTDAARSPRTTPAARSPSRSTRWRRPGCCAARAAASSCTTCRPARRPPGSTPPSPSTATSNAPRTSPPKRRRPTTSTAPASRSPAAASRAGRRRPDPAGRPRPVRRAVPGASGPAARVLRLRGGTAPRGARPRPARSPGRPCRSTPEAATARAPR
ncbi:RecB family exonuclease, partial [Actinomadura sp. CNU-125]|uniref:RecB family exonuclease n=1 Tax=Actinomadura sp. CNU-125 TaxID=1904961 RepID=UPI0021CC7012